MQKNSSEKQYIDSFDFDESISASNDKSLLGKRRLDNKNKNSDDKDLVGPNVRKIPKSNCILFKN